MIRRLIPHLFTLTNLLAGCLAAMSALWGNFEDIIIFVMISLVADFLDGFVARALGVSGELGKQLDSLADCISFGLVPAIILYQIMCLSANGGLENHIVWAAAPGLLFAAFAAYRLGKFNIDTRQTADFIGLATPGASVFVYGLMFLVTRYELPEGHFLLNIYFLYGITLVLCLLMVSEIPMMGFKFKNRNFKGNEFRLIFIFAAIILLIWLGLRSLCAIMGLYVILSLVSSAIAAPKTN